MIKWIKPSGVEIETNETKASIQAAESMGWERADKPQKKRGRPATIKED